MRKEGGVLLGKEESREIGWENGRQWRTKEDKA